MLFTVLILESLCGTENHSILFICLLLFLCCGTTVQKTIQNWSGGVRRSQKATGSSKKPQGASGRLRKSNEESGNVMKPQEVSGSLKKGQEESLYVLKHLELSGSFRKDHIASESIMKYKRIVCKLHEASGKRQEAVCRGVVPP